MRPSDCSMSWKHSKVNTNRKYSELLSVNRHSNYNASGMLMRSRPSIPTYWASSLRSRPTTVQRRGTLRLSRANSPCSSSRPRQTPLYPRRRLLMSTCPVWKRPNRRQNQSMCRLKAPISQLRSSRHQTQIAPTLFVKQLLLCCSYLLNT